MTREIIEYSGGKREGPEELPRVHNLAVSSYSDKAKELTPRYLVWLEARKLEKHALLLVPGWSGFNTKVSDRVVVVGSTISYLNTIAIDSPATDPEDRVQGLSRGCEIKKLAAVECCCYVFLISLFMPRPWTFTGDYWKHRELFVALDITMEGFHLLLHVNKCAWESSEADSGMPGLEN